VYSIEHAYLKSDHLCVRNVPHHAFRYVAVATLSVFSVVIFSNHIIPHKPSSWGEYIFALLAAFLPAVWLPMMVGVVASPECPDSAVLLDRNTRPVLPSGVPAQTTEESVADEAGRGAALGLLLMGIGSSGLVAYLVLDLARDPRPTNPQKKVRSDPVVVVTERFEIPS
jgi:ABC-type uncharacterized transport system YnjBCD permease subunit